MDAHTKKEIETIKSMVLKWKQRYIETQRPGENVALDFADDLRIFVYPYLLRLTICEYITNVQFKGLMDWCMEQKEELHGMAPPR